MKAIRLKSSVEQVAEYLRGEMIAGNVSGVMPGVLRLEAELGINRKTVDGALRLLEVEGLLEPQGAGRRRKISEPENARRMGLRVAILDYDPPDETEPWMFMLQHLLTDTGHPAVFAGKYLRQLDMEVTRIAKLVRATAADAWIVGSGSREVLAWFLEQKIPVFALFGRRRSLPIAGVGPDIVPPVRAATRHLLELGHQRIVMLCLPEQRLPEPGKVPAAFLGELEAAGISTGAFNLPDWKPDKEGFLRMLGSLFAFSRPTAMIVDGLTLYHAVYHFLASNRIAVPDEVSIVCINSDPNLMWCEPSVAHIHWDHRLVMRRVLRWADNLGRGKHDRRQTLTMAKYVPGGTVGPAPKGP
jgi:DNA-binding LacI/PurR family transcriptional regulator